MLYSDELGLEFAFLHSCLMHEHVTNEVEKLKGPKLLKLLANSYGGLHQLQVEKIVDEVEQEVQLSVHHLAKFQLIFVRDRSQERLEEHDDSAQRRSKLMRDRRVVAL